MRSVLRLFRYARPYQARVVLAIFSTIVVSALGAASAGALQPIFGLVFNVGSVPRLSLPGPLQDLGPRLLSRLPESLASNTLTLLSLGVLVLLLGAILRGIFSYLEEYLMSYVAEAIKRDLRDEMICTPISILFPWGTLLARRPARSCPA